MNTWKVILATLVIFGAGVVTGSFSTKLILDKDVRPAPPSGERPGPPPNPRLAMNRPDFVLHLKKRLELTPEQIQQIETLIHESQARTKPVWESIKPELREEIDRLRKEIKAVLTPEQQDHFEKILRDRRRGDDGKRRDKHGDDDRHDDKDFPRKDKNPDEKEEGQALNDWFPPEPDKC